MGYMGVTDFKHTFYHVPDMVVDCVHVKPWSFQTCTRRVYSDGNRRYDSFDEDVVRVSIWGYNTGSTGMAATIVPYYAAGEDFMPVGWNGVPTMTMVDTAPVLPA